MYINDNEWRRLDGKPANSDELVRVGSWLDKGTNEELLLSPCFGNLYRQRSWSGWRTGSGEVWFQFIVKEEEQNDPQ